MMPIIRWIIATGLLSLGGIFGLFISAYPLGWVEAYPPVPPSYSQITEPMSAEDIYKADGESLEAYYSRLANDVFDGVARFWNVGPSWTPADSVYTRVSPWDNYLLWAYSYMPGHEHFAQYEFAIPQKALDRGYGICSQVARIVYYTLKAQGMDATLKSQPSHVLVQVEAGLIDANYGVFVPHTTDEMKADPSLVDAYYTKIPGELPGVHRIFSEGNGAWFDTNGSDSVLSYMLLAEQTAEVLKWLPAAFLLVSGLMVALWPTRRRT